MRRATTIAVLLLVILGGVAIGAGAYHAGVSHGLAQAGHATQVVRVVGPGFGFPFGLFLFPLFFILIFALARGLFWSRRGGGPSHWDADRRRGRGEMFEDWHRRQHEQQRERAGTSGEPAGA
jgi:hypothetical protein